MKQIISSHNQKILITHFGAIGDTIMCTPALKLLRENLPLSRVEFLTSNRLAYDVLKHNNEIDDVHYFQQYNIGNIKKRFKICEHSFSRIPPTTSVLGCNVVFRLIKPLSGSEAPYTIFEI